MEIIDLLVGPVYITLAYLVLYFFRGSFTTEHTRPYFMAAFTAKVVGFIAFAFIYDFYYGGGDTFNYFNGSKIICNVFYDNPITGFQLFFLESGDMESPLFTYVQSISLFRSPEAWGVIRLGALGGIFSFQSYIGTCVFFALFCFIGMWTFFSIFAKAYPEITKSLALLMLFAPSTIFWGSALMKDTVALGAICWLATSLVKLLSNSKRRSVHLFIVITMLYLLITIKVYLVLCMAPAIAVWWFVRVQKSIRLLSVKLIFFPVILIFIAGVAYLGVIGVASQSQTFSDLNAIGKKVQGFHQDHGDRKSGSTYTLGEVEYTPIGFISKFPASVRIALFQPFPWEVKNIVMLLSSLESSLYLFLVIFIVIKRGLGNFIAPMFSHPEVAMCTVFTLILAFIVGFTSFNYGALVRFKIPFLPFLGVALALIYYLPKYRMYENQEHFQNR